MMTMIKRGDGMKQNDYISQNDAGSNGSAKQIISG